MPSSIFPSENDQGRSFPSYNLMTTKQAKKLPIGALLHRKKPAYCAGYLILARKEDDTIRRLA
jgi:hypothetical protein